MTGWFKSAVQLACNSGQPVGYSSWLNNKFLSGLLGLISLGYVWDQLSEVLRLYIYVLVFKLRVFNLSA
jgi:hypothetical protein